MVEGNCFFGRVSEIKKKINGEASKRISNGLNTNFWHDPWVGIVLLQVTFLRFFSLSTQKEVKVRELRELIDGVRDWSLGWVRNLFVWGFDILDRLLEVLDGKAPMEGEHMWWWNVEDNGGFLVKLSYNLVYDLLFRMWL